MDGHGARAPRERRLPAAAPLGQPPRPRPLRGRRPAAAPARRVRAVPPRLAGRHHRASSSEARLTLADLDALHRRVQPRRHQERLRRATPTATSSRSCGCCPEAHWGEYENAAPVDAPRPARRGRPLGRRPHRRPSSSRSRWTAPSAAPDASSAPRSSRTAGADRPGRAAGRAAARPRLERAARSSPSPTHLPARPSYAAVRAPIAEGGGYAWFANRGIGRPVAESLAATMAWFRGWLDDVAPDRAPGGPGRVQRRRRLRRRPAAGRPGPVRRRRDPVRHAALRRRRPGRPPAGSPACRCSSPRARRTP